MASILRVIEPFLDGIKESGSNYYRAASPFKDSESSSRSFRINTDTGQWVDYSAGLSGSLPNLLYRVGYTAAEVDKILEGCHFNDPLPQKLLQRKRLKEDYAVLPEWILKVYKDLPVSLLNLGFTEETLRYNDVGYDPQEERITFGVRDYRGRVVAVSGRATQEWQKPRYKVYNNKEFRGFPDYAPDSGKHLYGLHHFYERRRTERQGVRPLVIVEGYKGCMWVKQAGFTDTVAIQGSWMSAQQIQWLSRLPGPYVIFLDFEPDKQFQDPDKERPPPAIISARRLAKAGKVYLAQYPEDSEEGTAPDDLSYEQVKAAIERAISPAMQAIRNSRESQLWRTQP